ncbi:uncharacterized protein LOC113866233 [Abrus precatorius]|uniref:Uncharacterized protein LOC113866233 n=1 Tax=Abrus precatorius TaxID=3816 RepID=A0A8B8LKX6_ABRPR|nr:uncharacterized protein LOC113866233 [Abrus precatorius]
MEAWESIEEEEQWSSSITSETESGDNESHHHQPLDTLQHLLPIKSGISKFYDGKSKSFTSLADASSYQSIKDIAKPENAYSSRRRNLMALKEKTRDFPLRSNKGAISKRIISSTPSTVPLAYAINYDSTSSCTSEDSTSSSNPRSPLPSASATTATIKMPSSSLGNEAPHSSS